MIKDLSQKLVDASEKMMQEASAKQKEYRKFFDGMLKKYGVKSPSELSGDKKKEFFAAIEKGWTKDEQKEQDVNDVNEAWFKVKIKGFDPIFIKHKSASKAKAELIRSLILKNPKDIESVEKMPKNEIV